jgi:hypothetical protein
VLRRGRNVEPAGLLEAGPGELGLVATRRDLYQDYLRRSEGALPGDSDVLLGSLDERCLSAPDYRYRRRWPFPGRVGLLRRSCSAETIDALQRTLAQIADRISPEAASELGSRAPVRAGLCIIHTQGKRSTCSAKSARPRR